MNEKVNIQDIIDLFADKHSVDKKQAELFVKEVFLLIEEGLEKDKYVKIKGLGTFKLIEVDSRESVDVNTGDRIEIKGHTKVSFTPEASLKEIINRPFAHFESVVLKDNVVFDDVPNEEELDQDILLDNEANIESSVGESGAKEYPASESSISEIPVTEPVPSEFTSTNESEESKDSSSSNRMMCFLWILLTLILLCIGGLIYMYWNEIWGNSGIESFKGHIATEQALIDTTLIIQKNDTSTLLHVDTVVLSKDTVISKSKGGDEGKTKIVKRNRVDKQFTPDSTGYEIVGTESFYTIKEGETLTRIALKFYGTKALWPYIVKHNAKVIANPDNVPLGTTIKIPKLKKKQ